MSKSVLSAPHFHDEEAAYAFVEAKVWPHGPVCFHCKSGERVGKMGGKSTRIGLYKCYACRKPFTVKMGTIFESSHVEMKLWLQAIHLICASKKGISSNQLHRTLGVTLKTAWFMSHRIREAMAPGSTSTMGGPGQIVEADETEIVASRKTWKATRTARGENVRFLALVERGGAVRSKIIDERGMSEVRRAVRENLAPGTILHTDGAQAYKGLMPLGQHEAVNHNKQFTRESNNGKVYTNSAEGYFSLFKRGLVGTYQHMGQQHLARYLAEFDFRMSNRAKLGYDDAMRAEKALLGAVGKRLTYRTTGGQLAR
ncbi:IS1595 family transposase [Acidocella facilis]|uniref:IS1595 family transposase n=1 Tax=Acidocella facilis TaxID=525 RepID=UPI001F3DCD99|nr:IS1595 family transposase [Acidocella facilis]